MTDDKGAGEGPYEHKRDGLYDCAGEYYCLFAFASGL
jgi:hypothetical protein